MTRFRLTDDAYSGANLTHDSREDRLADHTPAADLYQAAGCHTGQGAPYPGASQVQYSSLSKGQVPVACERGGDGPGGGA